MAGSLFLLLDDVASVLDDVATMTKAAASKTAGVVGDDLALNAKQLVGIASRRELPVVASVAMGSLRNKAILVPAAMVVSAWLPWAIRPLLMAGGAYLCFEGFEKILHSLRHGRRSPSVDAEPRHAESPTADGHAPVVRVEDEASRIRGAVRTDFILSAEIIVIALGIVADRPLPTQLLVLIAVALGMTVGVYGLVAAIVRLDDVGAAFATSTSATIRRIGGLILAIAPWLLRGLSLAGTAAMFLVGGGILLEGFPGVAHTTEALIHKRLHGVGGVVALLAIKGLAGLAVGGVIAGVIGLVSPRERISHGD